MGPFPILRRAWRTQWRGAHGFALIFGVASVLAALLVWRYSEVALQFGERPASLNLELPLVGETLWRQSAWLQTLVVLLIAPALTAGGIARERERGLLESLQMAPLSPAQIALEKWVGALAPLAPVWVALFPLNLILVLSGGASLWALGALTGFQVACACAGAAIGLACSAWAHRAHLAIRSAYGIVILWLISSGAAAMAAGEGPLPIRGLGAPPYVKWWGRTNPIFAANALIAGTPSLAFWTVSLGALVAITLLGLWIATRALRHPLEETPFLQTRRTRPIHVQNKRFDATSTANATASATASASTFAPANGAPLGYFEVPLVGALRFDNPVMGREVRSKFRLRQPPVAVIVAEFVLGLLVLFFYARTLGVALLGSTPGTRAIIFWGVSFTGLTVTMASCAIMGANSLAREHEDGGWEGLRLSLLRPRAIVAGKVAGIALTCALFSLAVWPLLLPCVNWRASFWPLAYSGAIAPSQLVAVALIWLGSGWAATLWGLWLGSRTRKSSAASSLSLGSGLIWIVGVPMLDVWTRGNEQILGALNPFLALATASDPAWPINLAVALGAPFLLAMLGAGALLWALLEIEMKREIG